MSEAIPVVDVAGYSAGRPGARDAVTRQVHDAPTTVGFFVLTGHDVPLPLIECTFADWQDYWYDANYDPKIQRDVA